MIEIGRRRVTLLLTCSACQKLGGFILKHLHLIGAVLTEVVEDRVGLGESCVFAARTAKSRRGRKDGFGGGGGGSIRVACTDVKGKSNCLEELLVAVGALERESPFVLLEVIVHSVLPLLGDATMRANIVAGSILLIDVRH